MTLNYLYDPDSALRFRSSKRFFESDTDLEGVQRDKVAPISRSLRKPGFTRETRQNQKGSQGLSRLQVPRTRTRERKCRKQRRKVVARKCSLRHVAKIMIKASPK
jgi:hypothetical protein